MFAIKETVAKRICFGALANKLAFRQAINNKDTDRISSYPHLIYRSFVSRSVRQCARRTFIKVLGSGPKSVLEPHLGGLTGIPASRLYMIML